MKGAAPLHPIQHITALAAAVAVGWLLVHHGWPLQAWLPAAILAALGTLVLWVVAWFVARKLSYPYLARKRRRELKESGLDVTEL